MQAIDIIVGLPMPLPLLARPVRAGFPSPADDFIEEEIDLQRLLITNRPATFLVRVAGDSMVGARLFDGDLDHGGACTLLDHLELQVERLTEELAETRTEMRGVRYEAESLRVDAGRAAVFAALVEAERARSAEIRAERDRLADELARMRRPWIGRLLEDLIARPRAGRHSS